MCVLDGRNCLWGQSMSSIDFSPVRPLVCGAGHRELYGVTGFEDPKHWCNLALRGRPAQTAPSDAPSTFWMAHRRRTGPAGVAPQESSIVIAWNGTRRTAAQAKRWTPSMSSETRGRSDGRGRRAPRIALKIHFGAVPMSPLVRARQRRSVFARQIRQREEPRHSSRCGPRRQIRLILSNPARCRRKAAIPARRQARPAQPSQNAVDRRSFERAEIKNKF